jgi:uncharacterized membrane protein required for colicin V production
MRGDRADRAIGIALGLLLGLLVVILFVFVFSEDTVDAPSIDNGAQTTTSTAP